ncbi:MAG TPA: PAS domain S-box protein [Euryarchaeota archaeon]|nr:PAS domain S-box protein [Euryarchaeota archaeon]
MEFMETLPTGIMIFGKEGDIEFANTSMANTCSLSRKDIEGKAVFDLVEPADIPSILEILKAPPEKMPMAREFSWKGPGGARIHLMGRFGKIVEGDTEKIIGSFIELPVNTMGNDIPRSALEDLPFPVTILNKRLEPIYQNSAADEEINLVSKRKDPINHPGKALKGILTRALAEGEGGTMEVTVPMKGGDRKFDVIVIPLIQGGKTDKLLEIWMDISPSDSALQGGELPRGLGDELIENSNAIIIGIDMEGHIKIFNSGARRTLGYNPKEVMNTIWFDYLVDRDAEQGKLEVFQWNIGTGFRTQYESHVRASSGETITILLENTVIFDSEGEVSLVLMVGQDITKTKKLEQSLREQTDKLADAMEELSLYNDLMIHDIHNANAGIVGYLELLEMENIPESKKRDYVRRALHEVKKSSSIIREVKVMSKIKPNIQPEPVDLDQAFQRAISRWSEAIEGEMKTPVIERERSGYHVMADDLLEEALIRIFEISRKFATKKKYRISVKISRDPSMSNLIPEPIHLIIRDDGGSISEEMKEALMERPSSTEWGSHMLGLYLVRKIISRYGGLIWIDRVKGGKDVHVILSEAV